MDIAGGNAAVGTISAAGIYTAPADLPANPRRSTVTATSQQDAAAQASVGISLQNPMPVVTAVTPSPMNPGNADYHG